MTTPRWLVLVTLGVALGACFDFEADSDTFCSDKDGVLGCPARDAGGGADAGPDADAGSPVDAGGETDAGREVDAGDADAGQPDGGMDAGPTTAPCLAETVGDSHGFFVDSVSGQDTSSGGALSPFKTLARAVQEASTSTTRKRLFLAPGAWSEALTLGSAAAGVSIEGAWTPGLTTWAKDCAADRAKLSKLNAQAPTAVTLASVAGVVLFKDLVITSSTASSGGSTSGYGLVVRDASARLVNVVVEPGPGRPAATPTVPVPSGNACVVRDAGSCGLGTDGADAGMPGSVGGGGSFLPAGFVPAAGTSGSAGGVGDPGTNPPAPPVIACMPGCNGECQSTGGQCLNQPNVNRAGVTGTCGCGGLGGAPGVGALGGGASVALLVAGTSTVELEWSTLFAGPGGDGAEGGSGGQGGPGTDGGAGAGTYCHSPAVASCGPVGTVGTTTCGCDVVMNANTALIPGGSPGGRGGRGGAGSAGGSSAGGPSHAIVKVGPAASVVVGPGVVRQTSAGGVGRGGALNGYNLLELSVP